LILIKSQLKNLISKDHNFFFVTRTGDIYFQKSQKTQTNFTIF